MAGRPPIPEHRTCSLLVYGSLMHPQERRQSDLSQQPAVPVVLQGYRRSFHQEPVWRTGRGNQRGVLTVHPDPVSRLNGIIIREIPDSLIAALDHRERGYLRTPIRADQLAAFDTGDLPETGSPIFVYVGRPGRLNRSLRPLPEYRELCIAAAACWGEPFAQMFRETTLVADRPPRSLHA